MLYDVFERVRAKAPIIHNITNYVTVNDCANMLLACGASPIMADSAGEVEEITALSSGLCINIGTLNEQVIPSMLLSGKKANALGRPAVLDPVGAGASALRTRTARQLLDTVKFTVIRGNISEIRALALDTNNSRGVDADTSDAISEGNVDRAADYVRQYALETGSIIAVTGAIDIVTDGQKTYYIHNGHPMMSRVTGAGCQLSAVVAACVTANPDNALSAAAAAVCAMGLCGEKALARLCDMDGNVAYRGYIIDAMYNLNAEALEKGAKYEVR